jgi:hypothetical protein
MACGTLPLARGMSCMCVCRQGRQGVQCHECTVGHGVDSVNLLDLGSWWVLCLPPMRPHGGLERGGCFEPTPAVRRAVGYNSKVHRTQPQPCYYIQPSRVGLGADRREASLAGDPKSCALATSRDLVNRWRTATLNWVTSR